MKVSMVMVVVLMLAGCSGPQCADCCPVGDPGSMAITVACRVSEADGGAAGGVRAACRAADAGATTDGAGSFSFGATVITCGIATGSNSCGAVRFERPDGGALSVQKADSGVAPAAEIFSGLLGGGTCNVTVF